MYISVKALSYDVSGERYMRRFLKRKHIPNRRCEQEQDFIFHNLFSGVRLSLKIVLFHLFDCLVQLGCNSTRSRPPQLQVNRCDVQEQESTNIVLTFLDFIT